MSVPGGQPVSTAALCRLVLRSAVGVSPSLLSAINQQYYRAHRIQTLKFASSYSLDGRISAVFVFVCSEE
jgi:hypothetical protein